jgi:plasmid maintenance system antidote protein VapI
MKIDWKKIRITDSEFWLGLQSQYDLDVTADALGVRLEREVRTYAEGA